MKKDMVCIVCPNGCDVELLISGGKIAGIDGCGCKKGEEYARSEWLNPMRTVTTTVRLAGAAISLLPVKTSAPVRKDICRKVVADASMLEVRAPVRAGEPVARNISGSGADLVATRTF
jgi:CxxC motif-containing protein